MKLWIARDEGGRLYLHPIKPYLRNVKPSAYWNNEDEEWMQLREESFPEVTFENSPQEVELKLIEKLKYKEGDKVRIKSLDWYNENKDEYGYVRLGDYLFTPDLAKYCGEEFTISHTTQFTLPTYVMIGNGHEWSDEMIEGLVGEDFYMEDDELEVEKDDIVWNLGDGKFRVFLPDGYEFIDENGNVINATKIVLEKKKSKYPKTYEECCEIMNTNKYWNLVYHTFPHFGNNDWTFASDNHYANSHLNSLNALHKLLICRDAYWKLAGDWKPEFGGEPYYCIKVANYKVDAKAGFNGLTNCTRNTILAFPTEEMRDAFYENFKDLIEECKELL